MALEQHADGAEPIGNAFGEVETFDADAKQCVGRNTESRAHR